MLENSIHPIRKTVFSRREMRKILKTDRIVTSLLIQKIPGLHSSYRLKGKQSETPSALKNQVESE